MESSLPRPSRTFLDMNGYQWTVLFAAWLGWGFDIFDSLLFNYVAPYCVPSLTGVPLGTDEARQVTAQWTGILTSLLLLGWALGGIVFGKVADKIGRTKTLLLTMVLYSVGTAACALAPNMWVLVLCRFVASLGIGGEWAAGAAMVAEVVPEKRRVEAGALLYTAAPFGLILATMLNYLVQGPLRANDPANSWRYVFLCGLLPAFAAFFVRLWVKEPERWKNVAEKAAPPALRELFTPQLRKITISGFLMALVALLSWWSSNSFIPVLVSNLAGETAKIQSLDKAATFQLTLTWTTLATSIFNLGGLIGTLATIPIAKKLGRKPMFALYFALGALSIFAAYGFDWSPMTRFFLLFFVGLTIFGVFGSFTFYLPELFPTRLRGTGAGFCYNAGRVIAAAGPFLVGAVAAGGKATLLNALFCIGFIPLAGLLLLPLVVETKGRVLED